MAFDIRSPKSGDVVTSVDWIWCKVRNGGTVMGPKFV
jgi:hypothetical protein